MSILSETRILEFEFVALSADSIVIAYLRGARSPGQPYPPTLCDAIRRPTRRHACMHVFSRVSVTRNHPASRFGTFIAGRESYTRLSFVFSRVTLFGRWSRDHHHSLHGRLFLFGHTVPVAPSSNGGRLLLFSHGVRIVRLDRRLPPFPFLSIFQICALIPTLCAVVRQWKA